MAPEQASEWSMALAELALAQSEALVIVEQTDRAAQEQLDAAVRAYYDIS